MSGSRNVGREIDRECGAGGLANEFEVKGGEQVFPHTHPTHEFYYVTSGRGIMTIDGETAEVSQGDLIYIRFFGTLKEGGFNR